MIPRQSLYNPFVNLIAVSQAAILLVVYRLKSSRFTLRLHPIANNTDPIFTLEWRMQCDTGSHRLHRGTASDMQLMWPCRCNLSI